MLYHKPNIDPHWYDGLMDPPTEHELLELIRESPLVAAPGQDEVSIGVWKLAIQGDETIRKWVLELFSACLLTASFPSTWKTSIIVPLVKDEKKERTMSNIRPISLQNSLGKLFTKLLAYRLARIFQQHPILNPSQRGFILGGTTMKCIDELLDTWNWSRTNKKELYTIFYDIKQAYDSVQTDVLIRSLRRIGLPETFISLIKDSLSDLASCIRTTYGLTRSFAVRRSIRQGDPLAPILFTVLMDALHDGLELNPFDQLYHGCQLQLTTGRISIPSLGYADDTNVIANSLPDLFIQNQWVKYFMHFNSLRLNPSKCELVGRGPDGEPMTLAQAVANDISIDGQVLVPISHHQTIRYLGIHTSFDGTWKEQQNMSFRMMLKFTRIVTKFHLSIAQAVYMFNVFLLPKLELALHYVHGSGTTDWVLNCDRLLIGAVKHAANSPIRLSHTAVALTLNMVLPSWLETAIKISELFLRMNSTDSRWGQLGRIIMRQEKTDSLPCINSAHETQVTRTLRLATKHRKWSFHLDEHFRPGSRQQHLFQADLVKVGRGLPPNLAQCSSSQLISFAESKSYIAHDLWSGWNALPQQLRNPVHVYTDGSYDRATSSSA